tara:strand:+ start:89658 stop:90143 length:486 start_codon:yes stop_codon:yes gene_type:complete
MKSFITFLAGIFFGVLVVYAWHGFRYKSEMLSDGGPNQAYTYYEVENQSFYLPYLAHLIVEDVSSGQKYSVAFTPREGGIVDYVSKSLDTGDEVGRGSLSESYEVTDVDIIDFTVEMKNTGSSTAINVGSHKLEWSTMSTSGGWIYYNPYIMALSTQRPKS